MNATNLTALALLLASLGAYAQSSFSIPNPIIRPQSSAIAQGEAPGAAELPTPKVPPLPQPIGQAALPGQTLSGSAPSNETVIRETLATFNVTAIVGDAAILRNYVGYQPAVTQAGQSQSASQYAQSGDAQPANGSSGSVQQQPRQAVIRVKTNVPVFVAGVSLTPTVHEARVEFRITGRSQIISTVVLESQSVHGYVPPTALREAIDPAVQQRTTPATGPLHQANGYSSSSPPSSGVVPTTTGQPTPR